MSRKADKISDSRFREAAKRIHHRDGEVEVDDNAKISRGDDDGAYVQAWVWVYSSDAEPKHSKAKKVRKP